MSEMPLKVDTGKGFELRGTLYLKSEDQSDEVIILCHGLLGSRYAEPVRYIAEKLKYHVVSFDFQGNGESGGSTSIGNIDDEVENLRCVISHVRSKLNRKIRGICGHSKGAAVVLLYASVYNDIPLVINISARYDYSNPDYNEKSFTPAQLEKLRTNGSFVWHGNYIIRQEDLIQRQQVNMSRVNSIIKGKVRVLTIHGSKDEICPLDGAYTYNRLIGPEPHHTLKEIPDADHVFTFKENELLEAMESWLSENQSWLSENQF